MKRLGAMFWGFEASLRFKNFKSRTPQSLNLPKIGTFSHLSLKTLLFITKIFIQKGRKCRMRGCI